MKFTMIGQEKVDILMQVIQIYIITSFWVVLSLVVLADLEMVFITAIVEPMHKQKNNMVKNEHHHWIDTPVGRLFVTEVIICPVVSVSALTWFI